MITVITQTISRLICTEYMAELLLHSSDAAFAHGSETWPLNAGITQKRNPLATSA